MKNHLRRRKLIPLSLLTLALISSVFTSNCARHLRIQMTASKDLNSGGNPVTIRIYQLKNKELFKQISFIETFWKNDENELKNDLVSAPTELRLHPKESKEVKIKLSKEARYIAAVANFADLERLGWKSLKEIRSRRKILLINVNVNTIMIKDQ